MRVLHFYRLYLPENDAGIPRTIRALVRAGARLGIDATVLALGPNRRNTQTEIDGVPVWKAHLDVRLGAADFSRAAFGLFAELAQQADVVHYHFPWPFMDLVHFAIRPRKPALVTYHSDVVKQRRALLLYRPLMNAFLESVDRIVATSPNYVATSPVLQRFRDKVAVVPIGLDRTHYSELDPKRRAHWRERFGDAFFLFTGVLRYYKGLDVLLDAARRSGLPVVIVGDGPLGPALRTRAGQEGIRNVHFAGAVDDADKLALLDLCRAFVFPSNARSEAFGLSLVEAAMLGKPMITCEIGTGTSYVNLDGVTGLVVPPDDPAACAAAMARLADAPDLAATMGKAAQHRYEAMFTADAMAAAYRAIYRQLTEGTAQS